eukprot:11087912-Heterocapsa_arctica.AAC.1
MRIKVLAQDRPELMYAAKELVRDMKAPTLASWGRLKHLGRVILSAPRLIMVYKWQPRQKFIMQHTDSDHA